MAIQRQAENPGETLVIGEPFHYSIKPTKKRPQAGGATTFAGATHTVASVKKDLIYSFAVFVGIIAVLIALYFKLK